MKKIKYGFTLIELLVVVLIIGILAAGGYSYANYAWGNCYIYRTVDDSNAHAGCENTDVGIGYVAGFARSTTYQNERMCTSLNKNAQRVCVAETANDTLYYADETNQMWNYYYR